MLLFALLLDALLGEPKPLWSRVPHPVVLIGRLIAWIDTSFNTGRFRKAKGVISVLCLSIGALIIGYLVSVLPDFGLLEMLCVAVLLAHRSLVDHVQDVAQALDRDLGEGRAAVSLIVGRDTAQMDESAVSRAAIESAAENFSDGVVAPVFWYAVLGLPGILLYKTINTADSMIGYLSARHRDFGWAAARFDDLLNFVPARVTGALFCALSFDKSSWSTMLRDAGHHRSPNAGWPEAAMAANLNVALSGPRSYEGQMTFEPFVNANGRKALGPADTLSAVKLLWRAWGILVAAAVIAVLI